MFWEKYLQSSVFVAGEDFSLADIAFYPNLAYLVHRGMDLERERLPRLEAYCAQVGALPSVVDARPIGYEKVAKTNLFAKLYKSLDEEKRNTKGQT
jgi:glutathione S-transferase